MDFELAFSEELEEFRKEVGSWLNENTPVLIRSSDPYEYDAADWERRTGLRRRLGEKGWLYAMAPKEYGGGGLSMDQAIVIGQELERREITGMTDLGNMAAACILVYGTGEQKTHFLPPIFKGQVSTWQVLTEPQGGSDLATTLTTAVRDGDDYVVNGTKVFVGGGQPQDYMWTIVNTNPSGPRHQNLSYLMIPGNLSGISIYPLYLLASTGDDPYKTTIFFDNVRVPVFCRIGEENEGWKVANSNMELEHGGGGSVAHDITMDRLIRVLKEMEWNGRPLVEDPEIRDMLGEAYTDRHIQGLIGQRNFWMRHSGIRMGYEGPQLSWWNKANIHKFVRRIQDMLGYYALTRDPKYTAVQGYLEALQRTCFVTVHAGGGFNIQATIVARRLAIGRTTREEAGVLPV